MPTFDIAKRYDERNDTKPEFAAQAGYVTRLQYLVELNKGYADTQRVYTEDTLELEPVGMTNEHSGLQCCTN